MSSDGSEKDKGIEVEGIVTDAFRDAKFRVKLENGYEVSATISGRIRNFTLHFLFLSANSPSSLESAPILSLRSPASQDCPVLDPSPSYRKREADALSICLPAHSFKNAFRTSGHLRIPSSRLPVSIA